MASASWAGTITMSFVGAGRGNTNTNIQYNDGNYSTSVNVFTGQLKWNVTATTQNGIKLGPMITFCTDIFQFAATKTFNVVSLKDAPNSPPNGPGPMGPEKAAMVHHLYAKYFHLVNDASSDKDRASAFQIALWEIVNEQLSAVLAGNLSLTSGWFKASNMTTNAKNMANAMLLDVKNAWLSDDLEREYLLAAAMSDSGQDQIVIVPVPPAALMGLAGLAGAVVVRRRLRRI